MKSHSQEKSPISTEFPFESRFVEVKGSRMHYVEEGTGPTILFLHGNPTSSYLWRNILPHASRYGRAMAVDLIGMGKSDKPSVDYSFGEHSGYLEGFIEAMGLEDLTLVLHDWGSALGFHYASRNEDNVKAMAFMEAIVAPVPSWNDFPEDFRSLFQTLRHPVQGRKLIVEQNAFIEQVLPAAIVRELSEQEMDAYRAPYPNPEDRTPLWRWPNEIPIEGHPKDVAEIVGHYNAWLQKTRIPKLLFHAAPGALIRKPLVEWCKASLPSLKTIDLGSGIHFLQEDHPHTIGQELVTWLKTS